MATTNTTISPLIYPGYQDASVGSNNCIVKEPLTSSTFNDSNIVVAGDDTGTAQFDSRGFHTDTGEVGLNCVNVADIDDCRYGFTIHFEIENEAFLESAETSLAFFLTVKQTGARRIMYVDFDNANGCMWRAAMDGTNVSCFERGNRFRGSTTSVWITGGWGWYHIYLDKFWRLSGSWLTEDAVFTEFNVLGRGIATELGFKDMAVKNLAIWTRSMLPPPTTPNLLISSFGDSYAELGTYARAIKGGAITAETPDGLTAAEDDGGSLNDDDGMFPVVHAELARKGYFVHGNRIQHWAAGGSGVIATSANGATLGSRIDEAILSKYPSPQFSVIATGYNDLAGSTVSTLDLTDGTYLAAFQTQVNKLSGTVIVCNLIWTTAVDAGITEARVTAFNDVVASLTGITEINMFEKTGGFSIDASYLAADGIHPSAKLSTLYGCEISSVILNAL